MKRLIVLVTALALATLACGFDVNLPQLETGPTQTLTVSETLPNADTVAQVKVSMGAGKLSISPGAQEAFVEGTINYNVESWRPTITNEDGDLTIEQGGNGVRGLPTNDVVNEWDLTFGDAPMNLTINAGAYEGTLDLSGLALRNLNISDGASEATVKFDSVNPEEMEELRYSTGASSVRLEGLANANFERLVFKGGAGSYTLDFSGELQRDATVDITSGVSSVRLVIPSDMDAKIVVSDGITDVKTEGTWTVNDKTYSLSGSGPTLTINVDMGVGTLTLESK
jgi:hypothetical protein